MPSARLSRRDVLRAFAVAGLASTGAVERHAVEAALGMAPSRAGEILIRGGRIVNADGVTNADVRIVDANIAEVGRNLRPSAGAQVIEAANRLVMPGGVDPHTHLHPGFADDMTSGSMAALAGGITTVGTFATPRQGESVMAAIARMESTIGAEAIADVFLHASVWPPTPDLVAALAQLVEKGQPSIKLYMMRADFGAQLDNVIKVLEAARDTGVVTMIHCEDAALLSAAVRRLTAEGRSALSNYAESRPVIAEVVATQQAAALCESTRAPMYVVHLSSARSLEACRQARAAQVPLFVETRPLFLHLTEEKLRGPDAPLYVGQPPLRTKADTEAMWRGLMDGSIDVLATDHAPWTRAQKLDPALTIARVRPGASDLQFMLPMYFSEGVGKRRMTLQRFVETTSTNPARIFGLVPRKGAIRPGADADIAIWDPQRRAPVRGDNDFSRSDYSPYEGWEVTGWPMVVLRRGEIVFQAGAVTGQAGSGKLVHRERWRG
ncbi:MAG: dihydroorotase [Gemmatimonadaceae bacterium]